MAKSNEKILREIEGEFRAVLAQADTQYDPKERLLRAAFSSPGYHTALKGGTVHRTRESAAYALLLLDTLEPAREARAFAIIGKILALQDTDPASKTYGIWSWFLEEPLPMMSPPDWNWADFIGKELVQMLLFHGARLPEKLREGVRKAVRCAAESIIRRNVTPDYTNIHLMGTYVLLAAGKVLEDDALTARGRESMRAAAQNLDRRGGFAEYNSPTYTIVALSDMSILLRDLTDCADDQTLSDARKIYDALWQMVAVHYHPAAGVLAGPHSRCYDDMMDAAFFSAVRQGLAPLASEGAPRVSYLRFFACPPKYRAFFKTSEKPRLFRQVYFRQTGEEATTWIGGDVSLGSFSRSDMWNQRRPLQCYLATPEGNVVFRVRFLHDGYDFCSALVTIRQEGKSLVCAVNFADDYGDTHVNLDMIRNKTIAARDLRLRFEIGGAIGAVHMPGKLDADGELVFQIGSHTVRLRLLDRRFGNDTGTLQAGCSEKAQWLDLVFLSGEPKRIDFSALGEAVVLFGLSVDEEEAFSFRRDGDGAVSALLPDGSGVCVPDAPMGYEALRGACRSFGPSGDKKTAGEECV